MNADNKAVYYSYEALINFNCPFFCFWKYKAPAQPKLVWVITKKFQMIENATIALESINNVQENLFKLKLAAIDCSQRREIDSNMISFRSLYLTFCIYAASIVVCIMFFLVELRIFKSKL